MLKDDALESTLKGSSRTKQRLAILCKIAITITVGAISTVIPTTINQFSSVTQLCPTLCDPKDCSTLGFPDHHQLLEITETHVH